MRRSVVLSGFLFISLTLTGSVVASDWNQWRGPDRDGILSGGEPWPEDLTCLEEQWSLELGPGYPGVVTAKDRVFVAETHNEADEVVRALDRQTGKELWRASWSGSFDVPFFARANGDWIRSTPAYDGETLFVGGIREVVVALDGATGEERWSVDYPSKYGTEVPPFGFASSPMLADGELYVQAANSIIKVDKATGETLWRAAAGEGGMMAAGAFSSPIVDELAGKRQVIVQSREALHGIDPETGDELWSQEVPAFRGMNILTPLVWRGEYIFTSSYQQGTYLYRVQQKDGAWSSEQVWRHKSHGYMSSPVIHGDYAYLHLGNGRLTCIDLREGSDCWTSQPFGKYWSMILNDETLLALDERGDLILVKAQPEEFKLLDRKKVSDDTWAHLAVSGEQVFVRELEAVAAYRWCEGSQQPATAAPQQAVSAP